MMDQANSHLAQSCKCRTPTGPHANRAPRLRQRCRAWLSDAPTGQRICASPCRGCGDCASAGLRCGRRRYDGDITAQRTRLTPTGQRPVGFSSSVPPTRRTPTGPGMRRPRICGTEMRQTEIRRRDLRDGDTADGDTTEISPGRRYLRDGDTRMRCPAVSGTEMRGLCRARVCTGDDFPFRRRGPAATMPLRRPGRDPPPPGPLVRRGVVLWAEGSCGALALTNRNAPRTDRA